MTIFIQCLLTFLLQCEYKPTRGLSLLTISAVGRNWARGAYTCRCKKGYFSPHHNGSFNGSLVEGNAFYFYLSFI